VLITSSVTMVMAWASLERSDLGKFRMFGALTVGLGFVFLIIKYFEYMHHFAEGMYPRSRHVTKSRSPSLDSVDEKLAIAGFP